VRRVSVLSLALVLALAAGNADADAGLPDDASAAAVELQVLETDAGFQVAAESPDAGTLELTPPELEADSPARYPAELAGSGVEGAVELLLLIDESGEVAEAVLSSSPNPLLAEAALHAAAGLRFVPAKLAGSPVAVRIRFSYRFLAPAAAAPAPAADAPKQPLATVVGLVRAKGRRTPIPGAALQLEDRPVVEAGPDGRFELQVPAGERIEIDVSAPGFRNRRFRESLKQGEKVEVLYGLEPIRINPYETVVRGERERTEVSRVSLHAEEVREVPGTMGDPFRVVMLMPGVSSVLSGVAYPVVRGASPASTGYFLDGIRVPLLFHEFLGPAVVHPDFIDGLDFYPGAAPPQYGRLLGGVIEGHVSKPREQIHATLYADLINAGLYLEAPIERTGTSLTLAGRLSYTPWILALAANAVMPAPAPGRTNPQLVLEFWDYQGRIEQDLPVGKLRLLAFGSSDTVGTASSDPLNDTFTESVSFHRIDLRWKGAVGDSELEAGATYGLDHIELKSFAAADSPTGQRQESLFAIDENSWAVKGTWTARLTPQVRSMVGLDFEQRRARTTFAAEEIPFVMPLEIGTFAGFWGQVVAEVDDKAWTLIPGLRLDSLRGGGIEHFVVEPRLTVRRTLLEDLTVKGGAGLYHQAPTTLIDLPLIDVAGLRWGVQEAAQLDAGVEWKPWHGIEVTADVYFNPLLRTIELSPFGSGLPSAPQDPVPLGGGAGGAEDDDFAASLRSNGYAYGFEVMIRHPLGGNWFGWLSYSLQQSTRYATFDRLDANGAVVGRESGYLPYAFDQTHVLNAVLSYQFPYGVTAGAVFHLNTGRPEAGGLTSWTQVEGGDGRGGPRWVPVSRDQVDRLPLFWRVDLRLAKTWAKEAFNVTLYLDVLNVSAQSEIVSFNYGYDYSASEPKLLKSATGVPVIVPILGLKASY
jgi:TonB family protein